MVSEVLRLSSPERDATGRARLPAGGWARAGGRSAWAPRAATRPNSTLAMPKARRRRRDGRAADRGGPGRQTNCPNTTAGSCGPSQFRSSCRTPAAMSAGRCRFRCRRDCSTSSARACSSSPRRCPSARGFRELHAATGGTGPGLRGHRRHRAGRQLSPRHRGHHARRRPDRRHRGLWRALTRATTQAAYRIWLPLAALVSLQHSLDAFLAVEKYLLVKQGIFPTRWCAGRSATCSTNRRAREVDRLFDLLMNAAVASRLSDVARSCQQTWRFSSRHTKMLRDRRHATVPKHWVLSWLNRRACACLLLRRGGRRLDLGQADHAHARSADRRCRPVATSDRRRRRARPASGRRCGADSTPGPP